MQRRWDPTFSEDSHGFRPKPLVHQAVAKAQQYIAAGNRRVVDLDLEKRGIEWREQAENRTQRTKSKLRKSLKS